MALIVTENTYPKYPNAARAESGDIVEWRARNKNTMELIRLSDDRCVLSLTRNHHTGNFEHPKVGLVCQVKSKGYRLVLDDKEEPCQE